MDNYAETLAFLYSSLPEFQRVGAAAYKAGLERTEALEVALRNPSGAFRTVHIAGTNGKGSCSAMIYAVLRAAGLRVGLYTSPHLVDFRERIVVDDAMISEDEVVRFVGDNLQIIKDLRPSFFEMTVAMAFDHFRNLGVDVAVVEVGMGGRLDSTNIITPEVSVITNIDWDHTQFLGDTLAKIAGEKAGIIKQSVRVVIGESNPDTATVFLEKAHSVDAPITFADQIFTCTARDGNRYGIKNIAQNSVAEYVMPLRGDYQRKNLCTVLATLDSIAPNFGLSDEIIRRGLAATRILGRWDEYSMDGVRVICDTGHNPAGLRYVAAQLNTECTDNELVMVIGMVSDKDVRGALELLPRGARYIFTQASIERAMPAEKLATTGAEIGLLGEVCGTVPDALRRASELAHGARSLIFVGGSTFTVADALSCALLRR